MKCPECKREVGHQLINTSAHPDAGACCYDCLPDDVKKAYDEFFGKDDDVSKNSTPENNPPEDGNVTA